MLLESRAHSCLQGYLRHQGESNWPHHLTMARLVARALRVGRSALLQTSSPKSLYSISYLTPALLDEAPVLLVVPFERLQRLLAVEIPQLKKSLFLDKPVISGDAWPTSEGFAGLMLTTPEAWLKDRLENNGNFPANITTIIDEVDYLEEWARKQLTKTIYSQDWEELLWSLDSTLKEMVTDVRVKLTLELFAHPPNFDDCYLMGDLEQQLLGAMLTEIEQKGTLTPAWQQFRHQWYSSEPMFWCQVNRDTGQFSLNITPFGLSNSLKNIWTQQPIVLIGSFLDSDNKASVYRQNLGLPDLLCLKFAPNRLHGVLNTYVSDRLPLPNTPEFQEALLCQLLALVGLTAEGKKQVVLLVEDRPLRTQVAAKMAAEFGSRVQVETVGTKENILITGWDFWRDHQEQLPPPDLLAIATLPIPSLENPLVAARVAYHKRSRQDWFRLYLLPTALREIQRVVMSLRENQGVLAILDSRVRSRSYGNLILNALEPCAKINYIDQNWFSI